MLKKLINYLRGRVLSLDILQETAKNIIYKNDDSKAYVIVECAISQDFGDSKKYKFLVRWAGFGRAQSLEAETPKDLIEKLENHFNKVKEAKIEEVLI